MKLIKKPVTGMKDILPKEMKIREYVCSRIKQVYSTFGFNLIDTPSVEHIENLNSKQGGENEKLIFQILKRGEKLNLEQATSSADLVDSALRYDLTVPLARFFANNNGQLLRPFRALQIGYVWRADRPQKGRFRQFMQCDIDIIGEQSNIAEIDLITATVSLLNDVGFDDLRVRINDRRILKAMAMYCGFEQSNFNEIFILLDKIDKIGIQGVNESLLASGYDKDKVQKYMSFFENNAEKISCKDFCQTFADKYIDLADVDNLNEIITILKEQFLYKENVKIVFDPTLVRGMDYYTGPIFEIETSAFGLSIAGGGRYDNLIQNFTNESIAACGFSIGFERIISILLDKGYKTPIQKERIALLINKDISNNDKIKVFNQANELRKQGKEVIINFKNKNLRFQKDILEQEGYSFLES